MRREVAKSIALVAFGFAAGSLLLCSVLAFRAFDSHNISDVSIDTSSEWARYFLSECGYPVIRIRALNRSRERVDHVSFVGRDRPLEWFRQSGFEDLADRIPAKVRLSGTGFLPEDAEFARVVFMTHPNASGEGFYYVPEIGMLIFVTAVEVR